jgi:hypothetical protein
MYLGIFISANSAEAYFEKGPSLPTSSFHPIPPLIVPNSDTTLFFLASGAQFTATVSDPWFYSQQPLEQGKWTPFPGETLYVAEWPVNVVACAESDQICNQNSGQCSTMGGQDYSGIDNAGVLTESQMPILKRLGVDPLVTIISNLGSEWLSAYSNCEQSVCAPLPDNQWQIEFQNLFSTTLATMQHSVLSYVLGPPDTKLNPYWAPAPEPDSWMCHSQIVIRSDYASFSVLGVSLILSIGSSIVVFNVSFERLLGFIRANRGPAVEEWKITSLFQLQRLAFEGVQQGS